MKQRRHLRRSVALIGSVAAVSLSFGCATAPAPQYAPLQAPPPDTTVTFYPSHGQSPDRQGRDKYECNDWAVKQSGFDPSLPNVPPHLQVQVMAVEPPVGTGVAVGAATGAVLGAAVSRPWEAGQGALVGAVAGALIGGLSDSARLEQQRAAAATGSDTANARAALLEHMANNYRRAMAACLEGRGYTLR
jgi:YMGG-like Gly-zipper